MKENEHIFLVINRSYVTFQRGIVNFLNNLSLSSPLIKFKSFYFLYNHQIYFHLSGIIFHRLSKKNYKYRLLTNNTEKRIFLKKYFRYFPTPETSLEIIKIITIILLHIKYRSFLFIFREIIL